MSFLFRTVARWYQRSVHNSLRKYGLRYEDIVIAENPDYQAALKYIPKEEFEGRTRRLKRAMDLSLKHKELPKEIQAVQEPGKWYLADTMEQMRVLRKEREQLLK